MVAIQETNDELTGLKGIRQHLPQNLRALFSDAGGNMERMTFLFDMTKVTLLEQVGEVALPPSDYPYIHLLGVDHVITIRGGKDSSAPTKDAIDHRRERAEEA